MNAGLPDGQADAHPDTPKIYQQVGIYRTHKTGKQRKIFFR